MLPIAPVPGDDLLALFLDLDGTLVEIARRPEQVHADAGLLDTLQALTARLDGALAVVSGRGVDAIDAVLSPLRLPAAGIHGLELRFGAEAAVDAGADGPPVATRRRLEALADHHPGMLLEDKGISLALHYREAPAAEGAAEAAMAAELERLGEGFMVQRGKMVLELRPAGATKGTAVERFMKVAPFAGRLPVYIGDDVTDENAFRVVNEIGGLSIRVGAPDARTRARSYLDDVDEVHRWLEALLRQQSRHCA